MADELAENAFGRCLANLAKKNSQNIVGHQTAPYSTTLNAAVPHNPRQQTGLAIKISLHRRR